MTKIEDLQAQIKDLQEQIDFLVDVMEDPQRYVDEYVKAYEKNPLLVLVDPIVKLMKENPMFNRMILEKTSTCHIPSSDKKLTSPLVEKDYRSCSRPVPRSTYQ